MRLSQRTGTAIEIAILLTKEGRLTSAQLAARLDLSPDYCVKVAHDLGRVGIATAIRGCQGGLELSRDAKEITLLEVIEASEGKLAISPPGLDPQGSARAALNLTLMGILTSLSRVSLWSLS